VVNIHKGHEEFFFKDIIKQFMTSKGHVLLIKKTEVDVKPNLTL